MPALPAEPNKLDSLCACGADVPAGKGFFVRQIRKLMCASCREAEVAQETAPAIAPVEEKIKARIYWNTKVQRAVIALLDVSRPVLDAVKGLCEARGFNYNSDLGGWVGQIVSVPEIAQILEAAGIRVEVSDNAAQALQARADQNKKAVAGASIRVANVTRRGKTLKEYQKRGVEFLSVRTVALLGDDPGCVDGDAIVSLNRAGKGFKTTLKKLCFKFNGGESGQGRNTWDASIPTFIKALVGDHLRLHRIKAVVDKGVQPVWKLSLASGKTIRLTPDHEVRTAGSREFTPVSDLVVGDVVLTNGKPKCAICGSTNRVATYIYAKFPGRCRECIYRRLRKNSVNTGYTIMDGYRMVSEGMRYHPAMQRSVARSNGVRPEVAAKGVLEHRLVIEARMNGMSLKAWLAVCRTNSFKKDHVFLGEDVVVHHKNGDKLDNRLKNLDVMTKPAHAAEHGQEGGFLRMNGGRAGTGGLVQFIPVEDAVVSAESDGTAHVFDVVCEDPWRNFVANGVIVHNCGKTAQVLSAAGPRPRLMVVAPKIMVGTLVKGVPIGGWADEAALWRPDIEKVTILRSRDEFRWPEENEIVLLNYELMPVSPDELARDAIKASKARREAIAKGLTPEEPVAKNHVVAGEPPIGVELVCDEVHALANPNSQRTKRFKHLRSEVLKRGGKIRGVSATPTKNNAKELYSVLDAIGAAQLAFGSYEAYARLHDYQPKQVARNKVTWEFGEPSPQVAERLRTVMLRRKKRDVLTELPTLTVRRLVVDVDREAMKACDAAMKEIEKAGLDVKQAMEIVDQSRGDGMDFTKISAALAALAKVKAPYALERATEYERSGTPVIFMAAHLSVVEMLGARQGWGCLVGGDKATINFTGETVSMKGPEVAKRFQSGEINSVSATLQYAGAGVNLHRASEMLMVEQLWNPAMNTQGVGRMERLGQKNAMTLTVMVANHPLDLRMCEVLEEKLDLYAATIDAAAVSLEDLNKREDVIGGLLETAKKTAQKRPLA